MSVLSEPTRQQDEDERIAALRAVKVAAQMAGRVDMECLIDRVLEHLEKARG